MSRGRFIIVEGIDGSGKTTQVQNLAEALRSDGREVIETTSPGQWYRDIPEVREFIAFGKHAISANTLASLAAADRMMAADKEFKPALEAGVDIVCARYTYSALGYAYMRGANMDFVEQANSRVLQPSHGVLLALSPEDALQRIDARNEGWTHEEDPVYLSKVQAEMERRWPRNFLKLNASLPADEITTRIIEHVNEDLTEHAS